MVDDWQERAAQYNRIYWATQEDYLQHFISAGQFQAADTVLCVGSGTGIVSHAVAPLVQQVVEIDLSAAMLQQARTGLRNNESLSQADALHLPFSDQSFTVVVARMVLHHITVGIAGAVAECYRVLQPGGLFLVSEGTPPHPTVKDWYTRMFALKEQRLTFWDTDLTGLLQQSGFRIDGAAVYIMPQVSIMDWLATSDTAQTEEIMRMHRELDPAGKAYYRMTETDQDIYCDFRFLTLRGVK